MLTIACVFYDALFCTAQIGVSPKLVQETLPKYPKDAQKHRIQGPVKLLLTIAKDGAVSRVTVLSGKPELVEAATTSATTRKYQPWTEAGQPTDSELTTVVYFALTGAGPVTFSMDDPPVDLQFANGLEPGVAAPTVI